LTESLSSPEEYEILKEKLKMAKETKKEKIS